VNVDDGAIGDAANPVEPVAALTFNLRRSFPLTPKHEIRSEYGGSAARQQRIETKGKHILGGAQEQALCL
jgi:hypothetical protein